MAERKATKAKGPARRRSASRRAPSDKAERPEARIKALEQERDGLKAQLALAEARIAHLEESRVAVVNRIDWIIDSLQNGIEKDG